MKKQGVWITKIIMVAVGLFILAFMGYHVFAALNTPVRTTAASILRTEETAVFSGLVVRDEAAIELPSGLMEMQVAEGERVSKNQVIAVSYSDSSTMQINERIRALDSRREQLEYIISRSASFTETADVENEIQDALIAVMNSAARGEVQKLHDDAIALKASLFRREYTYGKLDDLVPLVEEIEAETDRLKSSVSGVSNSMRAPYAGLFSAMTDGYEQQLTPESMEEIDSARLGSLIGTDIVSAEGSKGKMVSDMYWYLMLELDEEVADKLTGAVAMRIDGVGEKTMEIYSRKKQENGKVLVILTSKAGLVDVISARSLTGEIVITQYEGVRVPKGAVRVDEDGKPYVYCLILSQIRKKPVSIISELERDNYFLVEYNPDSASNLLPGDEIVTEGKELYDGKVIR